MDTSINEEKRLIFSRLEKERKHFFVTGKAGTGKSTLLQYFRKHSTKSIAVIAPTGVAALNVAGQTLHSFFGFRPDTDSGSIKKVSKNKRRLYTQLEALVIDEISMVRSDTLDMVDLFLRKNRDIDEPFGGVQMIFFGDLFQLPPVVQSSEETFFETQYESPYFFDAHVMRETSLDVVELLQPFRQSDPDFLDLLDALRQGTFSPHHAQLLRRRVRSDFSSSSNELYITLVTTNAMADVYNTRHLEELHGSDSRYEAEIAGNFESVAFPTKQQLHLKAGAQVMMLNNDMQKRWVNGTLGIIEQIEKTQSSDDRIRVRFLDGTNAWVDKHTWEMIAFSYDEETRSVVSRSVGFFKQYPLALAWAVTIHKSQGKTFDRVVIDWGRGSFAHGQSYVALSRCRSLERVVLKRPLFSGDIIVDPKVRSYVERIAPPVKCNEISPANELLAKVNTAVIECVKQKGELCFCVANDDGTERCYRVWPSRFEAPFSRDNRQPSLPKALRFVAFNPQRQCEEHFSTQDIIRFTSNACS